MTFVIAEKIDIPPLTELRMDFLKEDFKSISPENN